MTDVDGGTKVLDGARIDRFSVDPLIICSNRWITSNGETMVLLLPCTTLF